MNGWHCARLVRTTEGVVSKAAISRLIVTVGCILQLDVVCFYPPVRMNTSVVLLVVRF